MRAYSVIAKNLFNKSTIAVLTNQKWLMISNNVAPGPASPPPTPAGWRRSSVRVLEPDPVPTAVALNQYPMTETTERFKSKKLIMKNCKHHYAKTKDRNNFYVSVLRIENLVFTYSSWDIPHIYSFFVSNKIKRIIDNTWIKELKREYILIDWYFST